MVLAYGSIFSRTSLDGRPRNLHTFSKENLKYTKRTFPVGQARCSFHLPHSYNLQILLARGNGASTNVEPWWKNILKVVCFQVTMHTYHRFYFWPKKYFFWNRFICNVMWVICNLETPSISSAGHEKAGVFLNYKQLRPVFSSLDTWMHYQ